MIPQTTAIGAIEEKEQPSKTYFLDTENKRLRSTIDGLEAVRQAVYLALGIERYDWQIYSWNYGAELKGLFGQPKEYVLSEIKRRITEALVQDDRIDSVGDFSFEDQRGKVRCTFTVHTKYGDFSAEKEVNTNG